jgi:hypothetical protein
MLCSPCDDRVGVSHRTLFVLVLASGCRDRDTKQLQLHYMIAMHWDTIYLDPSVTGQCVDMAFII